MRPRPTDDPVMNTRAISAPPPIAPPIYGAVASPPLNPLPRYIDRTPPTELAMTAGSRGSNLASSSGERPRTIGSSGDFTGSISGYPAPTRVSTGERGGYMINSPARPPCQGPGNRQHENAPLTVASRTVQALLAPSGP
jgi:hypothetical protein